MDGRLVHSTRQSSPAGAPNPTMHRGQAHAEAPSHLAQRTSATDGTDHGPSSFGQGVFDSCMTSENQFSITIPSLATQAQVFRRLCHKGGPTLRRKAFRRLCHLATEWAC